MATVVLIVDFPDVTQGQLELAAMHADGRTTRPTAWDILGLAWGGELDDIKHEVIMDAVAG